MNKNTLHIYTRVSTMSQEEDGTSLDNQKTTGIKRSKKLGYKHKVWNEGSQSSSKDDLDNRPVLTELLSEMELGNVKHLFVWNTDRLSRNTQTWGVIRLRLIKNNVVLHTPTGEMILSDPQTDLMLGILGEFSQYENRLRIERFRLGKIQRISEGNWKGGSPPYGYTLIESKLVPEEDESKWVGKIFNWYSSGHSLQEIKDDLMKNGVLTRRGKPIWSLGSLDKLLQNTHYDGYWYYTDKKSNRTIRVSCPRIIKPSLISKSQKVRKDRQYKSGHSVRTNTSVTKHTYLLSKVLKCGSCGSYYYGHFKKSQGENSFYQCGSKNNKYRDKHTERYVECGTKRNVRIGTIEKEVWDIVLEVIKLSHIFKQSIKTEMLDGKSKKDIDENKKTLLRRINLKEKEINKISDSLVSLETDMILNESRNNSRMREVLKKLDQERLSIEGDVELLNNELTGIESSSQWIDWLKVFKNKIKQIDQFSKDEKKEFLTGVVDEIVVSQHDKKTHKLDIRFKFPYVNDKLTYNDPMNKRKGYSIKKGKKVKSLEVNLLKKCTS